MKYDTAIVIHWLDVIAQEGRGLTTWEEEFIESVNEQYVRTGRFSDKQTEIIERIYADKTP